MPIRINNKCQSPEAERIRQALIRHYMTEDKGLTFKQAEEKESRKFQHALNKLLRVK